MSISPPEDEIHDVSNEILREARSKSPSFLKIQHIREIVKSKVDPIHDRVVKPYFEILEQQLK
jgi:hypothetical protein